MDQWDGKPMPRLKEAGKQVIDGRTAYQVVHMLEGVVQRGTAVRLRSLGIPLAGKTGTTSGPTNAWFFGGSGAGPGLFDAAVFAYTHLLLSDGGLAWRDRTLPELVEAFPNLVRHRARLVAMFWSDAAGVDAAVEDSTVWEKI